MKKLLNPIFERAVKQGKKQYAGMMRQLFREMPDDRMFSAKYLADMFEKDCPLDPKGLMDKMVNNLRINAIKKNLENKK